MSYELFCRESGLEARSSRLAAKSGLFRVRFSPFVIGIMTRKQGKVSIFLNFLLIYTLFCNICVSYKGMNYLCTLIFASFC